MRALVTGGGGFLGGEIVWALRERGDEVISFSRRHHTHLDGLGVGQRAGDLADADAVRRAVEGVDIVFHVAAKAGVWGPEEEYERANVTGTENVIAACRGAEVRRLVHTSSPSVVFDGTDMEGGDETAPYPSRYLNAYSRTKALAEQRVLAASTAELATVALRPHLIWGPRDNHIVPRLVAKSRAGELRRIGRRDCLVDGTYIDNAVDAHLLAADRVATDAPCAGKAYFIANDEPMPVWDLVNGILAAAGAPQVTRTVPRFVALAAARLIEWRARLTKQDEEPRMTVFVAQQLAHHHWFDLSAARRDLGYEPAVGTAEGLERLRRWLVAGAV